MVLAVDGLLNGWGGWSDGWVVVELCGEMIENNGEQASVVVENVFDWLKNSRVLSSAFMAFEVYGIISLAFDGSAVHDSCKILPIFSCFPASWLLMQQQVSGRGCMAEPNFPVPCITQLPPTQYYTSFFPTMLDHPASSSH